MSFEAVEGQRRVTADTILAKFGASLERAEQNAAARTADPVKRKLMGARMALEYAVLATAREKNMATKVVGAALGAAPVQQQAAMLREGSAALGRAYGVAPEVLVNVLAGRVNELEMPKGLQSTPEIDKMVDTCRTLVTSIVKDEYALRGRFEAGYITLQSEGVVAPVKTELAARVAFMEASIDAAVGRGSISQINADMLKERIEAQVFQPRPPQSLQFRKEFLHYFEQRGKGIRADVMQEVRGVTQSQTVQQIAAKLEVLRPAPDRPTDHRGQKPLER